MTVVVQAQTAGIDVVTAGLFPEPATQAGVNHNAVIFNLRRNFNAADPRASGFAFTFLGHVGLLVSPGAISTDLTFGWIQFMKQVQWTLIYGGRDDSEGQIEIKPLPLIGTAFLIDRDPVAGAAFSPFAQNPRTTSSFDAVLKQATANFGDHPMQLAPEKLFNTQTRMDNFLFSLVDIRKIVSIFAVRNRLGTITPLAHVNTELVYNGTFKWRRRVIIPATNLSTFTPGPVVKGAPADREVAGLMARLSPSMSPAYNATAQTAFQTAFAPGNANRRDLGHYEAQIPALFYLDGPGSEDFL